MNHFGDDGSFDDELRYVNFFNSGYEDFLTVWIFQRRMHR
jgi:hypothetical protein